MSTSRPALRGDIRFLRLPTDPPDKGPRPVLVVSADGRNRNPRARTVLVVPFTTSVTTGLSTHVQVSPGESGLAPSALAAEEITTVRKKWLEEPRERLRTLSHSRICELAEKIKLALGCVDLPRKPAGIA